MDNKCLIKIEPGKLPVQILAPDTLELEYLQSLVEGPIEPTPVMADLLEGCDSLIMLVNEEGKLFDLPFNTCGTVLSRCVLDPKLGPVALLAVEGEDFRPLTGKEADDVADIIEKVIDAEVVFEDESEADCE